MQAVSFVIGRNVDVYIAVSHGRDIARDIGFNATDCAKIEIAIFELTRNILAHAGNGSMLIEPVIFDYQCGLALEAHDHGPGIADVGLAMRDGYSTTRTLGAGLPSVHRLMDQFSIESALGVGTLVRTVKWLALHQYSARREGRTNA